MRNMTGKLCASAAAALLAVTAACGGIVPFGASAADAPKLEMSLLAGGSQIGVKFTVVPPSGGSADDYGLLINDSPYTLTGGSCCFAVNAAEMTESIRVAVTEGTTVAVPETETSVSDYLQTLLNDATCGAVCKAMLDYGYAAQNYFSSAKLSDYGLTAEPSFSGLEIDGAAFANKTAFNEALADTAVQYYGMNLTLLDQIRFSLYFTNTGEQADAMSYLGSSKLGGEQAIAYDISPTYSRIYATVPASKLCEPLEFENGSVSETFSPVQYLAAKAEGDNAKLALLCKALYVYGKAAADVQGQETGFYEGRLTLYNYETGCATLDYEVEQKKCTVAALTDDQYNQYAGGWIEITYGDKTLNALVADAMPFCDNPTRKENDVDIDRKSFLEFIGEETGDLPVKWRLIPMPNADNENVSLRIKEGSSQGWLAVTLLNARYPVKAVTCNGATLTCEYNGKNLSNNFYKGNITPKDNNKYTFVFTDIFDHELTVTATMNLPTNGKTLDNPLIVDNCVGQFPA